MYSIIYIEICDISFNVTETLKNLSQLKAVKAEASPLVALHFPKGASPPGMWTQTLPAQTLRRRFGRESVT